MQTHQQTHQLVPHPENPLNPVERIEVAVFLVDHPVLRGLGFRYRLWGDLSRIVLPEDSAPQRGHELWASTCFEALLLDESDGSYTEFNFSSARQWAAYSFDGYRAGMRETHITAPRIGATQRSEFFELFPTVYPDIPEKSRIGLSAVIEDLDSNLSYWALHHPTSKPDFHDPTCFNARLTPPV